MEYEMEGIDDNAYMRPTQPEQVEILVGPVADKLTISKELLSMKSELLYRLIQPSGKVLLLPGETTITVKTFIGWCYQDEYLCIETYATKRELNRQKNCLIELWIFTNRYDVTKLQNEAMLALITLLDIAYLFTKEDIRYIWEHTTGKPLRLLALFTVVAQVEEGGGDIREYEGLGDLEGLLSGLYTALHAWLKFESRNEKMKWIGFTDRLEIQKVLLVKEKPEVIEID